MHLILRFSDIENYTSQDIRCSPDVGTHAFQTRKLVKEGKSCAPAEANLVQMQSSSHPSNHEDVTLHDERKRVTENKHTNDAIDISKVHFISFKNHTVTFSCLFVQTISQYVESLQFRDLFYS